jgi:hypothetical protein
MNNEEIEDFEIEHEIDRRGDRSHCECGRKLASCERNGGLTCGYCQTTKPTTCPQCGLWVCDCGHV